MRNSLILLVSNGDELFFERTEFDLQHLDVLCSARLDIRCYLLNRADCNAPIEQHVGHMPFVCAKLLREHGEPLHNSVELLSGEDEKVTVRQRFEIELFILELKKSFEAKGITGLQRSNVSSLRIVFVDETKNEEAEPLVRFTCK